MWTLSKMEHHLSHIEKATAMSNTHQAKSFADRASKANPVSSLAISAAETTIERTSEIDSNNNQVVTTFKALYLKYEYVNR